MISASDVLQILSEIHQYSIVLIELRDATTIGISHSADGKANYFAVKRALGTSERDQIGQRSLLRKDTRFGESTVNGTISRSDRGQESQTYLAGNRRRRAKGTRLHEHC